MANYGPFKPAEVQLDEMREREWAEQARNAILGARRRPARSAQARENDLMRRLMARGDVRSLLEQVSGRRSVRPEVAAQRAAGRAACFRVRASMGLPIPPPPAPSAVAQIAASADWLYGDA